MSRSVVLVSGGIDSATGLFLSAKENDEIIALSVHYHSRHGDREMIAARDLIQKLQALHGTGQLDWKVIHKQINLPDIFSGGESALMGDKDVKHESYREFSASDPTSGPSDTVVPFRNANLISLAVTTALVHSASSVVVSMHATDHGGYAYPDCHPDFVEPMQRAVAAGTMGKVDLYAPFLGMTKGEVVALAAKMGVPAEVTYSCYEGGDLHCGTCPTCLERIKAFGEAGYRDPVKYANNQTFLGGKPWPVF